MTASKREARCWSWSAEAGRTFSPSSRRCSRPARPLPTARDSPTEMNTFDTKERTMTSQMTEHRIGTREQWLAAREHLPEREKEHTRLGDEIAQQRRMLPWVPVEKEYRFDTDDGEKALGELFDGRSQLLVYHFMFGPSYQAGDPVNSSIADAVSGVVPHLRARDASFVFVSQ